MEFLHKKSTHSKIFSMSISMSICPDGAIENINLRFSDSRLEIPSLGSPASDSRLKINVDRARSVAFSDSLTFVDWPMLV